MNIPSSVDNAEQYQWGDGCHGWHLLKRDDLSVIQECVPPGRSERQHYHTTSRQFFFILDGTATLDIEGKPVVLSKRQGIEVPPLVPHRLHNDSDLDVTFLVVSAPQSHGDRVNL